MSTNFAKTLVWKQDYDVKVWRHNQRTPNTNLPYATEWTLPMKIFCVRHCGQVLVVGEVKQPTGGAQTYFKLNPCSETKLVRETRWGKQMLSSVYPNRFKNFDQMARKGAFCIILLSSFLVTPNVQFLHHHKHQMRYQLQMKDQASLSYSLAKTLSQTPVACDFVWLQLYDQ